MATQPRLTSRQATGPVAYYSKIGDRKAEAEARRNLAEAKIAESIDKALAKAPPLTNQQVHRLTSLLRTGSQR